VHLGWQLGYPELYFGAAFTVRSDHDFVRRLWLNLDDIWCCDLESNTGSSICFSPAQSLKSQAIEKNLTGEICTRWILSIRPAGRKLGLGDIGWHTFRHTNRSGLDLVGTPIGVQQKRMRHAQIATTMNVYGNAMMESKREDNSKVVQMALRQEARKVK
jgi:hypothetical protein